MQVISEPATRGRERERETEREYAQIKVRGKVCNLNFYLSFQIKNCYQYCCTFCTGGDGALPLERKNNFGCLLITDLFRFRKVLLDGNCWIQIWIIIYNYIIQARIAQLVAGLVTGSPLRSVLYAI